MAKRRLSRSKRNVARRLDYAIKKRERERKRRRKVAAKPKPKPKARPKKKPPHGKRWKQQRANIKRRVRRDKKRVFGKQVPKRKPDEFAYKDWLAREEENAKLFQTRLAAEKAAADNQYKWTDEDTFIAQIMQLGLTEHEAYTLWFS